MSDDRKDAVSRSSSFNVSYSRIYLTPGSTPLAPRPSRFFGPRVQMPLFLIIGIAIAALHHFYYAYLHDKTVAQGGGNTLREQGVVNAVGNALAYLVNTFFSVAISIAFVQQFWLRLRSHTSGMSIHQMDIMSMCKSSISPVAASRAWYTAFGLFVISCFATSMALVSVFIPGSLRVRSLNFHQQQGCDVNTVTLPDNGVLGIYVADWFQRRVILSGSYIPPTPGCGDRACQYQVSFDAPAFNCTNITSTYDFTTFQETPPGFSTFRYVYNGTILNNGTVTQVASYNTSNGLLEAIQCTAYSATYDVTVTESNLTLPTVDVNTMTLIAPIPDDEVALDASNSTGMARVANTAVNLLNGTIFSDKGTADIGYMQTSSFPTPILNSPLFFFNHTAMRWTMDMMSAVPSIMQNISLSLLSDQVQDASAVGVTFLKTVHTQCAFSGEFYQYESQRLFVTYGAAVLITAGCIAAGLWAILQNGGVEETMDFSRMVDALVNAWMYEAREQSTLTKETYLRSDPSYGGMLRPL